MKKILLGVDLQNDFITGSLPVNTAEAKTKDLAAYIKEHGSEYSEILLSADWHPANHISFSEWPPHCIQHTTGAAIYQNVMDALIQTNLHYTILTKGADKSKEQYSAVDNEYNRDFISNLVKNDSIEQIDVCGIVGTICVKNTIIGLILMGLKPKLNILVKYTSNFDNDDEFIKWLNEEHIKYTLE